MRIVSSGAVLVLLHAVQGQVQQQHVSIHGQPKSGTTWLEVIIRELALASGGSADEKARVAFFANLTVRVSEANKHRLPLYSSSPSGANIEELYDATVKRCVDESILIWTEACVARSHYSAAVNDAANFQTILILRDPRSVVVSWYHYRNMKGSLSDYFKEKVPTVAALTSLRYYWHQEFVRPTHPTLILFYEDLMADPLNEYYRIASFLHTALPLHQMKDLVNRTSAVSMKSMEREGSLPGPNRAGMPQAKVRSASVQSFRGEVSVAAINNATANAVPLLHPALLARWLSDYGRRY